MKRLLILAVSLFALSAFAVTNFQYSVTLAWSPPTQSDGITGYAIYTANLPFVGTTPAQNTNGFSKIVTGNVTNATVSGLLPAKTNYFVATALAGDTESDFSNQVSWFAPIPPPQGLALISVAVQSSTDLSNWVTVTNVPLVYVGTTNGVAYYRALMNITYR